MTIFAILSFLLGAMLAHRFKVLILGPSVIGGAAVVVAVGIAQAANLWLVAVTVILFSVSLQIGYLCGTVTHSLMIASRAPPARWSA